MAIKIYNEISGRFGNSIFRYMASIVFCILYNGDITYDIDETTYIMTDDVFQIWMNRLLDDGVLEPMKNFQNEEDIVTIVRQGDIIARVLRHCSGPVSIFFYSCEKE